MTQTMGGKPKRTRREAGNLYYVGTDLFRPKSSQDVDHHAGDQGVLGFFRALGAGYQPQMDDVLRAFLRATLAGLIAGRQYVGRMP